MMRALLLMSQNESKFNQKGLELLNSLSLSGHAPASKFISELHETGHYLTKPSETAKHIYARTAQRQAGYLPPISKNYSENFSSLRDIPRFLDEYDNRKSEQLWTKTENETSKIIETKLSKSDNSLKNWLNEYEKRQTDTNMSAIQKNSSKVSRNSTQISTPTNATNREIEILNRSKLIEQTLNEIKIVDPISKLDQSLMLINNRLLLANSYKSIGYIKLMNSQLEETIRNSFEVLKQLSEHVNKAFTYPDILDRIDNTEKLTAAKNLWTKSFEDLRFGSIELVNSVDNVINLYAESGNKDRAEETRQKLNDLLFGESNYGFICVNFDTDHPLNKISEKLINSPFDTIKHPN